jgi:hypothetical protein
VRALALLLLAATAACVDLTAPHALDSCRVGCDAGTRDDANTRDGASARAPAPDAPLVEGDDGPTLAAEGTACTAAGQCASGFCSDGVCCQSMCRDTCRACNLPGMRGMCTPVPQGQDPRDECATEAPSTCAREGTCDGKGACQLHRAGTVCAPSTCVGGSETSARTCDGLGTCQPATTRACGSLGCGSAGLCLTRCMTNAECTAPTTCNGGMCTLAAMGARCTNPTECASGFCEQGVCCATACGGICRSCALAGTTGTCTSVPSGQDPLNQCADQGGASCGTTGTCDGSGRCRLYPAGTGCAPIACSGGVESAARQCDGAGACKPATLRACAPFGCNGAMCATTCAADSDCMYGYWCNGNTCADLGIGLIGFWKFEETSSPSRDSTAYAHNGVWEGAPAADLGIKPTMVHYPTGASLRCLAASTARVHVTRTVNLEPTGALSLALWVRRSGPGAGWGTIVRKTWMNNVMPTYGSYGLQLPSGDWSQIGFATGHAGTVDDMLSPVGALPDATWVHVIGVYDPSGAAPQKRLYINGVMVASKTLTTPIIYDTTATGDLYMCDAGAGNAYFNGHIDGLRIYRRALAAGEIRALAGGQ